MNRLFKNVNTYGLMGVLMAGGLVFTQSAFKPAKSDKAVELIYGYDYTNNVWVPNNTPGYDCSPSSQPCKYIFNTAPSPETRPQDSTPAPGTELGSYEN